ncbi:hypothetical protein [Prosthecobacter sp.]|jgi:hypothetical protein|uniref:hypothetical protein n=1 Tax=Prosthecobacter sp. TaxID=1965333 RepID=UPI0037CAFB2E
MSEPNADIQKALEVKREIMKALQSEDGRRIVDHIQRVFGSSASQSGNVSDARQCGRFDVIQYLVTHGELVRDRQE